MKGLVLTKLGIFYSQGIGVKKTRIKQCTIIVMLLQMILPKQHIY